MRFSYLVKYKRCLLYILTTNMFFNQRDQIFIDIMISLIILDQLAHYSHVSYTNRNSYRMKESLVMKTG
ncbi:ATP-binding protein [Bacillus sp. 3103sda1]|uniref:ATP-binding protein n=1 Tax=Bacillus sp. 3103sda1 TaxID=2953808 RepID=UPI0035C8E408